jgi:predicted AlkP superfamily pyrophosphatase or phosphodiesterase
MGQHGYDPALEEMQAVFLGSGAGFREAASYTTPFQNVDLYPLLNRLLWIQRDESRDGSEALSLAALRYDNA